MGSSSDKIVLTSKEGGEHMQATTERRQLMLEYLCTVLSTTRSQLMQEFGILKNTVDRDIQILMCSYPIETIQAVEAVCMLWRNFISTKSS